MASTLEDELYEKAFGKSVNSISKSGFNFSLNGVNIGEVFCTIDTRSDEVIEINKSSFLSNFSEILSEKQISSIELIKKDNLTPEELGVKTKYLSSKMIIEVSIDPDKLRPKKTRKGFKENLDGKDVIKPSVVSGIVNFSVNGSSNQSGEYSKNYNAESFLNVMGYVLEDRRRTGNKEGIWLRDTTSLVKDIEESSTRLIFGDNKSSSKAYSVGNDFLGLMISRVPRINPEESIRQEASGEFTLTGDSEVSFYNEEILVRKSKLGYGKYSISDLPLYSGINRIKVVINDEFGNVKTLYFNESLSDSILKKGIINYSGGIGKLSYFDASGRAYDRSPGVFGFLNLDKGITEKLTVTAQSKINNGYYLLGQESFLATDYGIVSIRSAGSSNTDIGTGFSSGLNFSTRFNSRSGLVNNIAVNLNAGSKEFTFDKNSNNNGTSSSLSLTYSLHLNDKYSIGLGISRDHFFDSERQYRNKISTRLNSRLNNTTSTSFSLSRTTTKNTIGDTRAEISIQFNLPESNFSLRHDLNEGRTSMDFNGRDIGYNTNPSAQIVNSKDSIAASLKLSNRNRYINGSISTNTLRMNDGETRNNTSYSASSRLAFGYSPGTFGVSVGPPISGSFGIIKRSDSISDQDLRLKDGSSDGSKRGLFGELNTGEITPYSYRKVELDTLNLKEGYAVENESLIFKSAYKTVNVISVGKMGNVAIRGYATDGDGSPIKDAVLDIIFSDGSNAVTFTNKNGMFYFDGALRGQLTIKSQGEAPSSVIVNIGESENGFVDLKKIKLMPLIESEEAK